MNPETVVVISGAFTVLGSTLAWFLARRDKKDDRVHSSSAPGAPTVQEIWQRQDRMEHSFRASLTINGEFADQWPSPTPPRLSQRAIDTLRESHFLPPELENLLPPARG